MLDEFESFLLGVSLTYNDHMCFTKWMNLIYKLIILLNVKKKKI